VAPNIRGTIDDDLHLLSDMVTPPLQYEETRTSVHEIYREQLKSGGASPVPLKRIMQKYYQLVVAKATTGLHMLRAKTKDEDQRRRRPKAPMEHARFFAGCAAACGAEAAREAAIVAHWHGDVRSVIRDTRKIL